MEPPKLEGNLKRRANRLQSVSASRKSSFVERSTGPCLDGSLETSKSSPSRILRPVHLLTHSRKDATKKLLVMKFGGTSVRDASCIEQVAAIIHAAARENFVAVVVSAMSGVTNTLVEAASQAQAGNAESVSGILEELRLRHESVANALIKSPARRKKVLCGIRETVREGKRLGDEVLSGRAISLRNLDAISGLGECLSAPLVAAALCELGIVSEAIVATEIVVTDNCHGAAEPDMNLTAARCEGRLRPLIRQGVVPVVTGFIGATIDGVPTTLGRNSSDYSGTIVGAALGADEVTLWTDVDGILTADPKLVPGAATIPEMTYREASDLAGLGAKVLHPKTLRPVMRQGIPLVIRNTFAIDSLGTRITPGLPALVGNVRALVATRDLAMVTVCGIDEAGVLNFWGRVNDISKSTGIKIHLVCQSESKDDIGFVISCASAALVLDSMRREFASDLSQECVNSVTLEPNVAVITVFGQRICGDPEFLARTFDSLGRSHVRILGVGRDYSETAFSFVIGQGDIQSASVAIHHGLHSELDSNSTVRSKSSAQSF